MKTFQLMGQATVSVFARVEAETAEEALAKVEPSAWHVDEIDGEITDITVNEED